MLRLKASGEGFTRREHLRSYLKDKHLGPYTWRVSTDDSTYDTVFQTESRTVLILRVHLPPHRPSRSPRGGGACPPPPAPTLSLFGAQARHPWLDVHGTVTGYLPLSSDKAWMSSRLRLGKAVADVILHLQRNPPEVDEIMDGTLRRLQGAKVEREGEAWTSSKTWTCSETSSEGSQRLDQAPEQEQDSSRRQSSLLGQTPPKGFTRKEHLRSYLEDKNLGPPTHRVSADDTTYFTVFQTESGTVLILEVHLPPHRTSCLPRKGVRPPGPAPSMRLFGVQARHPWIDAHAAVMGYPPLSSDEAWASSGLRLGEAVVEVTRHLQLDPPEVDEYTDDTLRRLQAEKGPSSSKTTAVERSRRCEWGNRASEISPQATHHNAVVERGRTSSKSSSEGSQSYEQAPELERAQQGDVVSFNLPESVPAAPTDGAPSNTLIGTHNIPPASHLALQGIGEAPTTSPSAEQEHLDGEQTEKLQKAEKDSAAVATTEKREGEKASLTGSTEGEEWQSWAAQHSPGVQAKGKGEGENVSEGNVLLQPTMPTPYLESIPGGLKNDNTALVRHCPLCMLGDFSGTMCKQARFLCEICLKKHPKQHLGDEFFPSYFEYCQDSVFANDDIVHHASPGLLAQHVQLQNQKILEKQNEEFLSPILEQVSRLGLKLDHITGKVERSLCVLTELAGNMVTPCPNLAILVPEVKSLIKNPSSWLESAFRTDMKLFFVCSHSFTVVEPPITLRVTKNWVKKVAPLLKTGLIVLKAAAVAGRVYTGLPIPLPSGTSADIGEQLEALDSLIDVCLDMETQKILDGAHASFLAGQSVKVKELVGKAYQIVAKEAAEPGNSDWKEKVSCVPSWEGSVIWVKNEYREEYLH